MSLNTATSGVTGATSGVTSGVTNNETVKSVKKGDVASTVKQPTKQVNQTTKDLTGVDVPGSFPKEGDDKKTGNQPEFTFSFSSILQWFVDKFESWVKALVAKYLPAPRRVALYEHAMSRPLTATFIVCQLICCGVPLLVFLVGLFLFALVAVLLWLVLSLLILGPVLLVTGCTGMLVWSWGWLFYSFVKWVDQKYLGGLISRFVLPESHQLPEDSKGDESAAEDKKEGS